MKLKWKRVLKQQALLMAVFLSMLFCRSAAAAGGTVNLEYDSTTEVGIYFPNNPSGARLKQEQLHLADGERVYCIEPNKKFQSGSGVETALPSGWSEALLKKGAVFDYYVNHIHEESMKAVDPTTRQWVVQTYLWNLAGTSAGVDGLSDEYETRVREHFEQWYSNNQDDYVLAEYHAYRGGSSSSQIVVQYRIEPASRTFSPVLRLQKIDRNSGAPVRREGFSFRVRFKTSNSDWSGEWDELPVLHADENGRSDMTLSDSGSTLSHLGGEYQNWNAYVNGEQQVTVELKEESAPHGYQKSDDVFRFTADLSECTLNSSGTGYIIRGDIDNNAGEGYSFWNGVQGSNSDGFEHIPNVPVTREISVHKISEYPEMTDRNPWYSLQGAVYGIYSDMECTNEIGKMTTDSDGAASYQSDSLDEGEYYIKELRSSEGYLLDPAVKKVILRDGEEQKTEGSFEEHPVQNPSGMLIQKVDEKTGRTAELLANAEFTVSFYTEIESEGDPDPALSGASPAIKDNTSAVWVLKTDSDGKLYFDDAHRVSGPDFWKNTDGETVFPAGTLTVTETKAPDGYLVNPVTWIEQIRSVRNDADTESGLRKWYYSKSEKDVQQADVLAENQDVSYIQICNVPERSIDLNLTKHDQADHSILIPDTVFSHRWKTNDGEKFEETLRTDQNGLIQIRALQTGTHEISETASAPQYERSDAVLRFSVQENGTIQFESDEQSDAVFSVSGLQDHEINAAETDDGTVDVEMYNEKKQNGMKLPVTGSHLTPLWLVLGGILLVLTLRIRRNET